VWRWCAGRIEGERHGRSGGARSAPAITRAEREGTRRDSEDASWKELIARASTPCVARQRAERAKRHRAARRTHRRTHRQGRARGGTDSGQAVDEADVSVLLSHCRCERLALGYGKGDGGERGKKVMDEVEGEEGSVKEGDEGQGMEREDRRTRCTTSSRVEWVNGTDTGTGHAWSCGRA
jgi:hypothetical protein